MVDINQTQWEEGIEKDPNAVIIDVRTPAECAEGIQPNAVQMNIQNTTKFIQDIDKLDNSKTYYIYCRSGARSGQACMLLGAKGFKAYNLSGGMLSWTGPTVKP